MTKAAPYLLAVTCVLSVSFFAACSEDEDKGCATDVDCARGQICDDDAKSCVNEPCQSLGDCPGSGRVCLQDTMTCSRRECGDGTLMCPEGLVCNNEGPYLWSCGTPPTVTPDALVIDQDAGMDAAMQTPDVGGGDTYQGLCQACTGNRDCAASVMGPPVRRSETQAASAPPPADRSCRIAPAALRASGNYNSACP